MSLTVEEVQASIDQVQMRCPVCGDPVRAIATQLPTENFRLGPERTPDMVRDALLVECTDEDCNWANEVSERQDAEAQR